MRTNLMIHLKFQNDLISLIIKFNKMASGFGCFVIGPAGSGKVCNYIIFTVLVYFLLNPLRIRRIS